MIMDLLATQYYRQYRKIVALKHLYNIGKIFHPKGIILGLVILSLLAKKYHDNID